MADYNEYKLEEEIAEHLASNGWLYSKDDSGYDRERALWPEDVFGWLADTQADELAKVVSTGSTTAGTGSTGGERQVLDALVKRLNMPLDAGGGSLNVLRRGFEHISAKFSMAQFQPESTLNPADVDRYAKNRLRVVRQVHFSTSDHRSIDLVLFVNGIPVATLELKTDFTQDAGAAIQQYRETRKPKTGSKDEPLLGFGTRALVHFAVSNDDVWMTTRLAGKQTHFLPFNRGTAEGGAGNPPASGGVSATAYLWRDVLQRDSLLGILGRFMHLETRTEVDPISGEKKRSTTLLFPRFHQWDAVTKLTEAVKAEGPGHKYLIQHSAGSGKTNSIAWTAHRLARLQVDNAKVFDSVIVVTDRNVLDAQLQETIKQISNDAGIVATIDATEVSKQGKKSKSELLGHALASGKLIIVVTIQTFGFVSDEMRHLSAKKFAVIADEAHSSQSGDTASKLQTVLTQEDKQDLADGGEIDVQEALAAQLATRAHSPNVSYFAFTATPKAKTLEVFGRVSTGSTSGLGAGSTGGLPQPFHVYSMKQAIEEGYILDVLHGYHSFFTAYKLASDSDVEVDQSVATKRVKAWVKLNPQTISQKAALIVEHFNDNVAHLLDGHAKAMVVSDSRLAATRFKREIDRHIAAKGYGFGTLVAFSGSISDNEYGLTDATEASLNPGAGDLRKAFTRDDFKIMIVANKFQTGFDQPLLCAMYIDRRLSGVTAVQTLSRLNRTYRTPSGLVKDTTMVVDFVNDPDDIRESFLPYFTDAHLETTTDPNLVWDLKAKLDAAGIYDETDLDAVVAAWIKHVGNQALDSALAPALNRYRTRRATAIDASDKAELDALDLFKKDLGTFLRVYDFLSQIYEYGSADLEKRSIVFRLLERRLRDGVQDEGPDLSSLQLVALKLKDQGKPDIALGERRGLAGVTEAGSGTAKDPKMVALADVLAILNDLFADEFGETRPENFLRALVDTLSENESLVQQARANTAKQFAESPDFDEAVVDAVADNQGAYATMADFFFADGPTRRRLIIELAKAFHELSKDAA